jgi:(2Fe-2S) ferredoxin
MNRLSSSDDLARFRQDILSERNMQYNKPTLLVSAGTCGQASGSNDIIRMIKRIMLERGLQDRIGFRITGCQGFCEMDPAILVQPGGQLYPRLRMEDVPRVIDAVLGGYIDEKLIYKDARD